MPATHSNKPCPLSKRRLRDLLLGLTLLVPLGCQPKPSESTAESRQTTAPRFPWESWYAYYIAEEHVGFNHVTAELISIENQPHLRYRKEEQVTVRRGSTELVQQIEQEYVESSSGHPVRLETTVRVGADTTRLRGRMDGEHFRIKMTRGEETTAQEIAWQSDYFGPHAVEQSLRDHPLKAGDRRVVQTLMPVQNRVARAELHAVGHEVTDLGNGRSRRLLKVENRLRIGETQEMTSYAWTDELGRTIKLAIPSLRMTGYRTNRTVATTAVAPQQDVLPSTFVLLDRRVEQPERLKQAIYRITLAEDATLRTLELPELPGQTIAAQQDGSLRVTVEAGVHRLPVTGWAEPAAADLAPGPLVDYETASVQGLAVPAVQEAPEDAQATALHLTRFVHEHVVQKDFSRGFAKASQVAEEAAGDCTEHAVLLAALLRDQGIPARLAAGLVYLETANGPAMGYHMWNLAFIEGGWMALDATLGTGLAPANRIAILTTDLASGNEYECLMPVLTALGQFKIEVVRVGEKELSADHDSRNGEPGVQ